MRYREQPVTPPLDRWVECVWVAEGPASAGAAADTIVPDGCPELIVQLGDPFRDLSVPARPRQPKAALVGPLRGPFTVQPVGRVHTVGVRFRPAGLAAFLRVPIHELTDRTLPLEDLFGPAGRDLADGIAEAGSLGQATAVVEGFLRRRLLDRPVREPTEAAVVELIRRRGQVTVEALAARTGVGPRHLERCFRDAVGLTPKRLARIVRLQEVLRRLGHGAASWVDVALECGYADQAHLTREFHDLAGQSPSRWIQQPSELARAFTDPARLESFFVA